MGDFDKLDFYGILSASLYFGYDSMYSRFGSRGWREFLFSVIGYFCFILLSYFLGGFSAQRAIESDFCRRLTSKTESGRRCKAIELVFGVIGVLISFVVVWFFILNNVYSGKP